jgi:uncharacterized phage protein gp47/JayE
MNLSLQNMQTMLDNMIASAQSVCSSFLDFSSGSPARAIIESEVSEWSVQQSNIYLVLIATRLSSSNGNDVDTFVNDFGLYRETAVASTGPLQITLSSGSSTTILVGDSFLTGDTTLSFTATADSTLPYWNASVGTAGGYVVPANSAPFLVPVQCTTSGTAGNVVAGAITLIGQSTSGVYSLTNPSAFTNGSDTETDIALKIRFVQYIASLSKATLDAILEAVASVQTGLTVALAENVDEQGNPLRGHGVITVDDGSGYPPDSLLIAIYKAVDAVRAWTVSFSVQRPIVVPVSVYLTVTVVGNNKASLIAPIQTAITNYINSLPVGGTASVTRVANVVYNVDNSIINIDNVTITTTASNLNFTQFNGDITANSNAVVKTLVTPVVS